jgi:2,3-dihydro-2,3-dihydroxybenzoate dehydrogenase
MTGDGAGETTAAAAGIERAERADGTTVVVGAAQGIGAGIARRLATEEWTSRLVLADLKLDGCRELAAELGTDGLGAEAIAVDVTDAAQVANLVGATADAGRVVIASGAFAPAPALEVGRDEFARIQGVNLMGAFFVAQGYARAMAERGSGAIVGVASIAARMPRMRQAAYCASKAGLRQALRVLGMEVAPLGVRVNTVSPGATDTPMMRALAADHASVDDLAHGSLEAMRPRIPNGRVARPDDVANVVSFLLAPSSEHVFLQDIVVDGGELLGM